MSEDFGIVAQVTSMHTSPGTHWQPIIGEETSKLLERQANLDPDSKKRIVQTAVTILARGQPPVGGNGSRTGIVVGYVQSGKTLSFTTVIALARDNNIPIVIVAAGTSEPLLNQTKDRLISDLQIDASDGPPSWLHINNADSSSKQIIEKVIRDWRDESLRSEEKATLLITVMKQWKRLENLNLLLSEIELEGIPALVIDDEADQASLNNRARKGGQTPTYQQLLQLRRYLPNHTFLQYTATPQAPLLINIIDVLSPNFVQVLEPGGGYVGGREFFDRSRRYARVIPAGEVPSQANVLEEAPSTLLAALRIFFVSVAAGLLEGWSRRNPNRSMLVHPSRTTAEHFQYYRSIEYIRASWAQILNLPEGDPDKEDLLDDFRTAYNDLSITCDDLPSFGDICVRLPRAVADTQVREINRRGRQKTPTIMWQQAYGWILVGGQAMDRGFTVRELSVTYMPRGPGTGNADTLQQRARFFGYKRHYIGHCRIYLEAAALNAFEAYVEHEEVMRAELSRISTGGGALTDWKRRFILSPALQPCRRSVVQHNYIRGNYSDDWFFPKMVKMSLDAVEANSRLIDAISRKFNFEPDNMYHSNQVAQQHLVSDAVPLDQILNEILVPYRVEDADDTDRFLGLMLQIERALDNDKNRIGRIYHMRPRYEGSHRSIDKHGRINSIRRIHQGPTKAPGGYSYPGDIAFRDPNNLTVQIHCFDLTEGDVVVRRRVPILAIFVPQSISRDWLVQGQPQ